MVKYLKNLARKILGFSNPGGPAPAAAKTARRKPAANPQVQLRQLPPAILFVPLAREISEAIKTLAVAHGQFHGMAEPSPAAVADAWLIIERNEQPLAAYLRSCIGLGLPLPTCPRNLTREQEHAWLEEIRRLPVEKIGIVLRAIWNQVPVRAYRHVNDVLARRVTNYLRGASPQVTHLGGPAACRETHIRESDQPDARVLIRRIEEHGLGGPLKLLDAPDCWLSWDTVRSSGWALCPGWVEGGGGGGGQRGRPGGAPEGGGIPPANDPEVPEPKGPKAV